MQQLQNIKLLIKDTSKFEQMKANELKNLDSMFMKDSKYEKDVEHRI